MADFGFLAVRYIIGMMLTAVLSALMVSGYITIQKEDFLMTFLFLFSLMIIFFAISWLLAFIFRWALTGTIRGVRQVQ
ncbi:MAG: hypothetical protein ACTSPL_04055 [Candidatus Odinarchaeia archaeon]